MNTTGLNDVEIDLRGTLLVSLKYTNKLIAAQINTGFGSGPPRTSRIG
jgi:hypothetical protein